MLISVAISAKNIVTFYYCGSECQQSWSSRMQVTLNSHALCTSYTRQAKNDFVLSYWNLCMLMWLYILWYFCRYSVYNFVLCRSISWWVRMLHCKYLLNLLTVGEGRRGKAEEVDDWRGGGKMRGRLFLFDCELMHGWGWILWQPPTADMPGSTVSRCVCNIYVP